MNENEFLEIVFKCDVSASAVYIAYTYFYSVMFLIEILFIFLILFGLL